MLKKIVPEKNFINNVVKEYNKELDINHIVQHGSASKDIEKLLNNFDIRYNHIQHQFKDSECGVYSIHFITRLVSGESFDSIIHNVIKDDVMNSFRKNYFINVN